MALFLSLSAQLPPGHALVGHLNMQHVSPAAPVLISPLNFPSILS